MRVLRFVGLGIIVWGLGLLWPQVNQLFTPPIASGIVLGLGAVAFAYVAIRRLDYGQSDNGTSQDHPSRPVPVTAIR
jgi:hypothetical protein